MTSRRALRLLMPWLATIFLFAAWELACWLFKIDRNVLPAPSLIVKSLLQYPAAIAHHSLQTLYTTVVGFGLAIITGMLIGLAIGASSLVYAGLYPLLIAFNSVPKVALVPILVIWFGIGTIPAILTAWVISFFPIVVNVATGLATIEPEMRDVLRSLGASRWQILTKVGIPRSMPYLFGSLKVAITLAFIGSVISETVAGNDGIGYMMLSAAAKPDTPLVFSGLLVISFMGVVMYALCAWVESQMTGWAVRGGDLVS